MNSLSLKNFSHFYFNKYLVTPFINNKYPISYCYHYNALWFRTYKVASRTIHHLLDESSPDDQYVYSSPVSYLPSRYSDFFKFAFVRDPVDRFISIWSGMVLKRNYFGFSEREHQKMKDFKTFLNWVEKKGINKNDIHLVPQHELIDINNIDFLGRFETFQDDFLMVASELDIPIDESDIQHRNKSPNFEVKIDEDDRNRIINLYRKDIEIFYPNLRP